MPVITICSSASFYQQANQIKSELEAQGLSVLVPKTATLMQKNNDYDVRHYKTWFAQADDYPKKAALIRDHFAEVEKADAILVINNTKHDQANYIGGNVLMEMAVAFHKGIPIFVQNDVPKNSPFLEEILGMQPTFLHGKHTDIPKLLKEVQ